MYPKLWEASGLAVCGTDRPSHRSGNRTSRGEEEAANEVLSLRLEVFLKVCCHCCSAISRSTRARARSLSRKLLMVGHDDLRHLFVREFPHDLEDFVHQSRIELRRRFVVQHDFGLHRQASRNGDALLLSAGERRRIAIRLVAKTNAFENGAPEVRGLLTRSSS